MLGVGGTTGKTIQKMSSTVRERAGQGESGLISPWLQFLVLRKTISLAGENLSCYLQSEGDLTILCYCRYFSVSLSRCCGGLYSSLVIPGNSAFSCAIWIFVFASRCSCAIFLWLIWSFDGKKKNSKTKQILDLPSPGAAEGTIPSCFSIYPSKAVPTLRAYKIPGLPWQVKALAQVLLLGIWRCSCFQRYAHTRYEALLREFRDQMVWSLNGPNSFQFGPLS